MVEAWGDQMIAMIGNMTWLLGKNLRHCVNEKKKLLHVCMHSPAQLPKKTQKAIKSHTFQHNSQKYTISILLKLHTPPHTMSLPSNPCFHLVEAGENRTCLCYSGLYTHCGPQQESLQPHSPGHLTQALRSHLMSFQTDLILYRDGDC